MRKRAGTSARVGCALSSAMSERGSDLRKAAQRQGGGQNKRERN